LGLSRRLRRFGGMTNEPKRTGDRKFIAFENALRIIDSLRGVVVIVRRHDRGLAQQIVSAASSVAANLAEGNERVGRDRLHLFRIAAGSAAETRAHLRVALAWRWIGQADCAASLALIDEELAMLWRLTH
jgi:four helix bundle protein